MRFITIAVAGLVLCKPMLIQCQDNTGLMGLADYTLAISTNSSVDQICLVNLPENVMTWFLHFNVIALEGFVTGVGHAMSGPLYVHGQFSAQGYSINGQSTVDCSARNQDALSQIGLVIDAPTKISFNGALNGNGFVPIGSEVNVLQESANCQVYQTNSFGPVSFATIVAALQTIENALINLPVTLKIKTDGTMEDANPRTDPRYDKVEFSPCTDQTCTVGMTTDSDTNVVLFNGANWMGPTNRAYPDDSIILFSIPVWANFSIYLNTDTIGAGVQPCRAIYHFYPVSGNPNDPSSGVYDPTAQAEVVRDANGYLAGLTFAPKMVVSDGNEGGFAGQLVAKYYQWQDPTDGTNILDYSDLGDICQGKFVCFPPTNYTRPAITNGVTLTTTAVAEATLTLQDIVTVTLPTIAVATVYANSTHVITVHQTFTDTTTERKPGFYNTFTEGDDTTTTEEITVTLTNTHTHVKIEHVSIQELTTTTEPQATTTTSTSTNVVLVPHPTLVTITEYSTIYTTAYKTTTLTITETEHTSISSSSESESESSESFESSSSSSQSESDSSSSDSSASSSIESSSEFTDECTQTGNHKTHHHHYHHEMEEDCEDESHHHHHKDEENCEDESHHHYREDEEKEDEEDDH